MARHPLVLSGIVFVVLMCSLVVAAYATGARPRSRRQWLQVLVVVTFLAWVLLGVSWVRA